MTGRKLVPLTGIGTIALVVSAHTLHSGIPPVDAPVATLTAFYRSHQGPSIVGSVLIGLAAAVYLAFATAVRDLLDRDGSQGGALSAFAFGGAVLFAVGLTVTAGIGFVLGHAPDRLSPVAIQSIHALFFDLSSPLMIGNAVFLTGIGIAIIRARALPAWLGIVALVVAVVSVAPPPIGDAGSLVGLALWIIALSVTLAVRRDFVNSPSPSTA